MVEIPKTTFADYTALPESNQIIELIDGEIVVNPPLDQHQQVVGDIYVFSRLSYVGAGRLESHQQECVLMISTASSQIFSG